MYKCQYPNCDYETSCKSHIQNHHIIPKENKGSNHKKNRIYLCPTHHTKVYIPESKQGIHTIKGKDSIIINGWRSATTSHRILEYIDESNQIQYSEERI